MRKLLLLAALGLSVCMVHAQSPVIVTIKGIVQDSATAHPLPYVTITIIDVKSGQSVKTVLTKEKGAFEVGAEKDKPIQLVLSFSGYNEKKLNITPKEEITDLGILLIGAQTNQLNEIKVTATRPLIKQEADRIVFDAQADPENKVTNVLDMLRKVPLVSVDGQDNIRLNGSGNYKILINGKPSALVTSNPADVFKSMPATNIVKIEVITTPPAKYDAEGLAGIINIITKKKMDQGYNGSVNARYTSVWGSGLNLNGTVKQGKFGLSGYAGYGTRPKRGSAFGFENDIFHPVTSRVIQNGERTNWGNNAYGTAELSLEIDTLNLLTGSFEGYKGNNNRSSDQASSSLNENDLVFQQYRLYNYGDGDYHGTDLSLNFEHGFKRNKEQLLTTSYKYSSSGNQQNTEALFSERLNYDMPDYRQYNNSGTKEHTAQLDYVYPGKNLNIEAGAKTIFRNSYSLFTTDNFDEDSKLYINDPRQSNNFNYQQNIYGAYNSYQYKKDKVVLKAGLRVEHTTVDADFTSTSNTLHQNYTNLVPSVSGQRTFNKSSITLGFSQRIQRPGIWQLNPFVDRSNPKFINVGNPDLQPVVNRNIELGYSNFTKGSINLGVNYSFANNTVENVTSVNVDTVTTSTYMNVGSNKRLALNLNANYPFTPKLNVNINAQLMHVWLKGTYNNQFYYNKGFQGHVFSYVTYKFEKGYRVSANMNFDSRYVLLQGRDNYYIGYAFSGSKTFLKEKATISLSANSPFKKFLRLDFYTNSPDFRQMNYFDNYYRNIYVSFNYKFGKLNSSLKKNQRGISNDDTSGSSQRQ